MVFESKILVPSHLHCLQRNVFIAVSQSKTLKNSQQNSSLINKMAWFYAEKSEPNVCVCVYNI